MLLIADTKSWKLLPSSIGLSRKDSFNLDALAKHLAHLQKRLQELKEAMLTKYVPVENMAVIEERLSDALRQRDKCEEENEKLKLWYNGSIYNIHLPFVKVGSVRGILPSTHAIE